MIFYKDDYVTIYNEDSKDAIESDVIVLDPPSPVDVSKYRCKNMIIFCGGQDGFYRKNLNGGIVSTYQWGRAVPDDTEDSVIVFVDQILVTGSINLKLGTYMCPVLSLRDAKWERPLELLIDLLTPTDGNILDPFLGTGTTAVASKKLGRQCIGYEIDKKLCEIAARRCMEVK